jgi:RNA polymerase sigma-B factor
VPRDLHDLAMRVNREEIRLESSLGRAPTVRELADAAGAGVEAVVEAIQASSGQRAVSLDGPGHAEDHNGAYADCFGAEDAELARAEDRAYLDALVSRLQDRERELLRLRFGHDMTQSEIARHLGISQMHVSRLIRRALARAGSPG